MGFRKLYAHVEQKERAVHKSVHSSECYKAEESTGTTWTVERVQSGECLKHRSAWRTCHALRSAVVGRAERSVLGILEELLTANDRKLKSDAAIVLFSVQFAGVRFAYLSGMYEV